MCVVFADRRMQHFRSCRQKADVQISFMCFKMKAKSREMAGFELDHKDKISDYDQYSDNILGSLVLIRFPLLTTFFKGFAPMR